MSNALQSPALLIPGLVAEQNEGAHLVAARPQGVVHRPQLGPVVWQMTGFNSLPLRHGDPGQPGGLLDGKALLLPGAADEMKWPNMRHRAGQKRAGRTAPFPGTPRG